MTREREYVVEGGKSRDMFADDWNTPVISEIRSCRWSLV